ncbi:hypothetical protein BKG92_08845 [Rodentibacter ratti]|uniref:Uncharacterized protein n=2 Tax=Rodentibacter ratti TaxID=1906745 RepID=A0A1V3KVQ2_9PAST|nr:hypothetical protein BKG92_08845 [Rodentibacter ratti]
MLKLIDKLKLKFGKNEKKNELELRKEPEQKKELEPRKGDNQGQKGNKLLNIGLGLVIMGFGGWLNMCGETLLSLEHVIPTWHIKYMGIALIASGICLFPIGLGKKEGVFKSIVERIVKYIIFPIGLGGITNFATALVAVSNLEWLGTGFVLLVAGALGSVMIDLSNDEPFKLMKEIKQKSVQILRWVKEKFNKK